MDFIIIVNTILIFLISLFFGQSLSFLFGFSINNFIIIPTIIVTCFYLFRYSKHRSKVLLILLFACSIFVSNYFFDLSWDGQDYQQEAIIKLKEGWNPVYQTQQPENIYYNQWINHYPKLPWIYASSLYKLTDNIEIGKNLNLLLIFCVFLTSYVTIGQYFKQLSKAKKILISLIISLNPVCIYQSQSYYVDGLVYSSLVLLLNSIFLILKNKNFHNQILLITSLVLSTNIKFTGTFYAVFILLYYLVIFWKNFKSIFIKVFLISLILFLITGVNPYFKNTLFYGNPFYPVFGSKEFNTKLIMSNQDPIFIRNKNKFEKFYLSLISKPTNKISEEKLIKLTKTSKNDLTAYQYSDVRVNGFGPLFLTSLILSALLIILNFKTHWKKILLVLIPIIITVFSNPESWWARYIPQFYLIPVLLILILNKYKFINNLIISILIINSTLVLASYYSFQYKFSNQQKLQLIKLAQTNTVYNVNFFQYKSNRIRLYNSNIKFNEVKKLTCKEQIPLIYSTTILCP